MRRESFVMAWKSALRLLTRFDVAGEAVSGADRSVWLFLPAVGALLGFLLALSGGLLVWLAGRAAATLLGSLGIAVLWWWLGGGRSERGIVSLAEALIPAGSGDAAAPYFRSTVVQLVFFLRLLCIGVLLYSGRSLWLVVVSTLTAAALAELLRLDGENGASGGWPENSGHWLVAAAVALPAAGLTNAFVPGLVALVISWLLPPTLRQGMAPLAQRGVACRHGERALLEGVLLLLGLVFFLTS